MLYAKVVFSLAVQGPFDYSVPENMAGRLSPGMRVWVTLRSQKILGYVVGVSRKTKISNLKPVSRVIDDVPLLDSNMLLLTKKLSDYYCCSWGEAIDSVLPEGLRRGREIPGSLAAREGQPQAPSAVKKEIPVLIHDIEGRSRWGMYISEIRKTLEKKKPVIVLMPDIGLAKSTAGRLEAELGCPVSVIFRKHPKELKEWLKIRNGEVSVVVGTRSCVFAPVKDLGLIIIDEEENSAYKQDQIPHYHAREAAYFRADIEGAKLILGSPTPSLESMYLAKKSKIGYQRIPLGGPAKEVKIIDTKNTSPLFKEKSVILRYITDSISSALEEKGKILLFLNRKGFATFVSCRHCHAVLRCPRCNINLVYHFKANLLSCHYCNFKMAPPNICPECNSGYLKYAGTGTEKIESELCRLFPQAKIFKFEKDAGGGTPEADITISTQYVIKLGDSGFDLICVLFIDNSLNRIDFRASEKAFGLLFRLLGLARKKIIVQTSLARHHCIEALVELEPDIFYSKELKQREELGFPPFSHFIAVNLRGKYEEKVKQTALKLFDYLDGRKRGKGIDIISVNPKVPGKLRGNYYWQVLLKGNDPVRVSGFLKMSLKNFLHSGIILTVDVDP